MYIYFLMYIYIHKCMYVYINVCIYYIINMHEYIFTGNQPCVLMQCSISRHNSSSYSNVCLNNMYIHMHIIMVYDIIMVNIHVHHHDKYTCIFKHRDQAVCIDEIQHLRSPSSSILIRLL